MTPLPVIAIFDIGKTNKKILLFNSDYQVVYEEESTIPLISDEDGFACDDLDALVQWIRKTMDRLLAADAWSIGALNFSTFGASLVHLDKEGQPLTPLYSYLKPLDKEITGSFYGLFPSSSFSLQTGSPVLGMLNSGIQLYWLKKRRPGIFKKIHCSLHLPQYLSYLFTGKCTADITSVGCHTGLWDVQTHAYHRWLEDEDLLRLLPSIQSFSQSIEARYKGTMINTGIGLHDSSASVLPFTLLSSTSLAILSTGTWNITMLPAFAGELRESDYQKDCLYYLLGANQPIAAARIFLGHEIECQLKKMSAWFGKPEAYYLDIRTDPGLVNDLIKRNNRVHTFIPSTMEGTGPYPLLKGEVMDLSVFSSFEEAYHKLMLDSVWLQKGSMDPLLKQSPVEHIYVTGGFAKNILFMDMLQHFFPSIQFHMASVSNGSALGAALALHDTWNKSPLRQGALETRLYEASVTLDLSEYVYGS